MKDDLAQKPADNRLKLLALALNQSTKDFLVAEFSSFNIDWVCEESELEPLCDEIENLQYDLIICGSALGVNFPLEVAQLFSMEAPESLLYFIGDKANSIRLKELEKNGFNRVFLYPLDSSLILTEVAEAFGVGIGRKTMTPVPLELLVEGLVPEVHYFVYLPLNRKFCIYIRAHEPVSDSKVKKLKAEQINQLYVRQADFPKYVEFNRKNLQNLLEKSDTLQSKKQLKAVTRNLFMSIFDEEEEEKHDPLLALEECQSVILEACSGGKLSKITRVFREGLGGADNLIDKSQLRATLVALLGVSLKSDYREALLTACVFQDLGLWDSDGEIEKDGDAYLQHPEKSLKLVKQKLVGLSAKAQELILSHHERYDGQGFPRGIKGDEVSKEVQILNFVNQLEELTAFRSGRKRHKFEEAVQVIIANGSLSPAFVQQIEDLLLA
jgi:hypothetical protein